MKAPINEETKAAFMAQYFGQKVAIYFYGDPLLRVLDGNFLWNYVQSKECIVYLRDISSLTDEEKKQLAKRLLGNDTVTKLYVSEIYKAFSAQLQQTTFKTFKGTSVFNIKAGCDYLIERGILLPFRGILVPELISLGWATIRKEGE